MDQCRRNETPVLPACDQRINFCKKHCDCILRRNLKRVHDDIEPEQALTGGDPLVRPPTTASPSRRAAA